MERENKMFRPLNNAPMVTRVLRVFARYKCEEVCRNECISYTSASLGWIEHKNRFVAIGA